MVSSFGRVRKRNRSLDDDFLEESDEDDLLGSSLLKQRYGAVVKIGQQ